jgi:hypothetical protein
MEALLEKFVLRFVPTLKGVVADNNLNQGKLAP